jgi:phosphoserine aminotransferase
MLVLKKYGTTFSQKRNFGKSGRTIPVLRLRKHIKAESMYNTPAIFLCTPHSFTLLAGKPRWYCCCRNNAKAGCFTLTETHCFKGAAAVEDRSNMNATF